MYASRGLRVLAIVTWVAAGGCTTLREIPREDYAAAEERKRVVVETREGVHQFDRARVDGDTLTGYRQRDTEGEFEEVDTFTIPLDAITRLSTRRVDWYRTALAGGAVLSAVVLAALARRGDPEPTPEPNPCGPRGCPE